MDISFFSGAVTFLCCFFAAAAVLTRRSNSKPKSVPTNGGDNSRNCVCGSGGGGSFEMVEKVSVTVAGGEKQTGASMMEQLVPEITTHALSYLDYPSLCRLSMTNSLMRKAANDDNAWKALYHKDFTLEQDSMTPINGWKAYYAATRAIMNVNAEFFRIIKERSLPAMERFWLNADYVKCFHASGEYFTGYNAVMGSWQLAFNWEQNVDFEIRDVRARVMTDSAWVTMKAYLNMGSGHQVVQG
ncbi:PREDICTED: F-box protein SKIP8 isoform X2 [Nicotiana attenuata]|uniref:F-box protein SKIP8 isoform X2 n=1 Tax=Nicotiana attenuata TaxID=49451 RepID=UPI000904D889|nr:PREDICTED: F-box protein SKIP8 isoform X2 [Nicotiana attenuata]